jgi:Flp pilus assembly protein TadD
MWKLFWSFWFVGCIYAQTVTFNRDVAPIIYQHCAPCHHEGGIGPFPLMSYSDVRKHAGQIVSVTERRYMPPWPPQSGFGSFRGDRHLSDKEIKLISDWVKNGKLEGLPETSISPPAFAEEWQMGKPDLVLQMPQSFTVPAGGSDIFRNFIIPSGLRETRYIRGFELRLHNKRAVHHANVVLDRTQSLRRRDRQDGQPGFPGMDVTTEASANDFDPDSHFLFWKPASILHPEPDDMSWRLDPETDLVLNLHLQPTGKPEPIQAEIGLYFASRPPTKFPMLLQLEHDGAIHIPPGDRGFSITDQLVLPVDVDLLAIYPHAHYLGKLIEAWATTPDGRRQPLIRIPDWDINWQATYEYREPIFLPKGTTVAMRITYDNSPANERNPNHPPRLVESGNRSEDEMGHVWLQVLPRTQEGGSEDGRLPLQEAVMRRRLQKYGGDFLANYNLGALLQSRGKLDEAGLYYRQALRIEPRNATALNSLATVLLLEGQLPEAMTQLRAALTADPNYLNARYNLARALAATGDLNAAEAEYSAFLAQRPEDASAQAALGVVCFAQRKYPDALAHLQAAARLNPNDADVQANLGTVLAIGGNLPAAIQAFEESLRLNPEQPAARQNLMRAKAALAAHR